MCWFARRKCTTSPYCRQPSMSACTMSCCISRALPSRKLPRGPGGNVRFLAPPAFAAMTDPPSLALAAHSYTPRPSRQLIDQCVHVCFYGGAMVTATRGRVAPGPKGRPILGSLPDFQRDIVGTFMQARREFGDVVHFKGPLEVYLVAHPDHVDKVLHADHRNYRHPDFEINKLKPTFRNGLVTSQGEFWLRQRRLAQPTFHRQKIVTFAHIITPLPSSQ